MMETTDVNIIFVTTSWYDAAQRLHRDGDLPAVVWTDGSQSWYKHGRRHRDGDLPAVVWSSGTQWWYRHGKKHRDADLPAVVFANGRREWWVNGRLQSDLDREHTRKAMAQAARWSPLRAAWVGVVAEGACGEMKMKVVP
jgi:hypothetical protein